MNESVFNNYVVKMEQSGSEWSMIQHAVIVTDEEPNELGVLESHSDDYAEAVVVDDYASEGLAYDAMMELDDWS